MDYYFPGLIDTLKIPHNKELLKHTVNSGENAVRLILRIFGLQPTDKVAVPLFVCDSLKNAVIKEGLQPLYLDIKENNYWTNYDLEQIKKQGTKAVILVHLYGFIYPDTNLVSKFCQENGVFLIHDMAQCYGADESLLTFGSIIYSFGPGKSTTAAGGGLIKAIDDRFYKGQVNNPSRWANIKSNLFLKSRIYGYEFSIVDKVWQALLSRCALGKSIECMNSTQKDTAEYVIGIVKDKTKPRKERYELLLNSVSDNPELAIAYDDNDGLYFKCVINVKGDVKRLKAYLAVNHVPFFSLFDSITIGTNETADKPMFILNAKRFIELSTEASIPISEVKRVGEVLAKYR